MSGRSSRSKGQRGERDVVRLYKAAGADAERCLVEVRDGNVGDVTCSLPLTIQVKRQKSPSVWRALAEAEAAAPATHYAVAHVHRMPGRGHNSERVVAMKESDWMEIVETLVGCGVW